MREARPIAGKKSCPPTLDSRIYSYQNQPNLQKITVVLAAVPDPGSNPKTARLTRSM